MLLIEWTAVLAVSLVVALAVVSPFFFLGTASGHDIEFHMASWLDAAGQWKQGVLFPRWAEWPNYGFGEPRFIFYPPLSWLFGAFLGSILPWNSVAVVFIICVQTLSGLSAYALLRNLCDSRWATRFGAACFSANPYALVIIYARSDFAELLAIVFFPLFFLSALRLCSFLPQERTVILGYTTPPSVPSGFRQIAAFALPFCAIWLSNAPAGIIATYTAAFLIVFASLVKRSLVPALRGAAAMLLGFGLASFYLMPAIYEQRWIHISGALAGGLTPGDNFLYARTTDAEHDAFNHVASSVAVVLLVWTALAAVTAWRRSRGLHSGLKAQAAGTLAPLGALSVTVLLLMLPLTALLWRSLPELRFVQFPWRWMSVLAVCALTFMTLSLDVKLKWIWPLAAMLAIVSSGWYLAKHTWWDTEDMPTLEAAMKDGAGFEGTDEYDPAGDDHTDLPQKQPKALFLADPSEGESRKDTRIFVDEWAAERRSLRVVAREPGRLAIHLLNYPAWRVTVNGSAATPQHPKGTQQIIIPVPQGESRVQIEFTRTLDRTVGGWISILCICGAAGMLFGQRRR